MEANLVQEEEELPFKQHMLAGCFAGLIEHVMILPLDNIKTHQQVIGKSHLNIRQTMKQVYEAGGLTNFYQGINIVALGTIPAHALYFGVYEFSKVKFGIKDETYSPALFALTGAIATFFHDIIITPIDVVKQRQQISMQKSKVIFNQLKINEGLFALIRSFKVTYFSNACQTGMFMAFNESLKVFSFTKNEHSFFSHMTCAGIAGGLASFLTTPLDVIKTKLQTQKINKFNSNNNNNNSSSNNNSNNSNSNNNNNNSNSRLLHTKPQFCKTTQKQNIKYISFKDTAQTILKEEGFRGFFNGAPTRMLMVAPAQAVQWASYEYLKKLFISYSKQQKY